MGTMPMRRSGKGCGNGGTVQDAMTELEAREGRSGVEDMTGEDEGEVVLLLDEVDEGPAFSVLGFGCLELLDVEKMALNMMCDGGAVVDCAKAGMARTPSERCQEARECCNQEREHVDLESIQG